MPDVMTAQQRSRVMARNCGKNTSPERFIETLLRAGGLVFERHAADLPGKPDFVFPDSSVAVFIDGDFWHGWRFPLWSHRMAPFWREKIERNRQRDRRNFARLRRQGWNVLRIWEHQVEENIIGCVERIVSRTGQAADHAAIRSAHAALPPLKRRMRLPKP